MVFSFMLLVSIAHAAAFPAPVGHISDLAGIISAQTKGTLEQRLVTLERETGVEVVVATTKSLEGDAVENVAVELFKLWGIGKKKEDNGVLLLIAKEDRQSRIEVGYGLEGTLTDIGTSRIQREILVPAFKLGEFDRGVSDTIDAIEMAVRGDASINVPTGGSTSRRAARRGVDPTAIFYGIVIGASWLASVLARSKSWWAGGVIGAGIGLLGGLLLSGITFALGSAAILALLGAVFDYFVSRDYEQRRRLGVSPHWWAGGSGWHRGGWGGGGGFGGFGGGRSGGGGSSARW